MPCRRPRSFHKRSHIAHKAACLIWALHLLAHQANIVWLHVQWSCSFVAVWLYFVPSLEMYVDVSLSLLQVSCASSWFRFYLHWICLCDLTYLLLPACRGANMRKLGEYLVKYQDPLQADSLSRLQADVDDTTQILVSYFWVKYCSPHTPSCFISKM